jgi:hypothetical protein
MGGQSGQLLTGPATRMPAGQAPPAEFQQSTPTGLCPFLLVGNTSPTCIMQPAPLGAVSNCAVRRGLPQEAPTQSLTHSIFRLPYSQISHVRCPAQPVQCKVPGCRKFVRRILQLTRLAEV